MSAPVRVAVVEDRAERLARLREQLASDPRFDLVATFSDGQRALREWSRCLPQVALVRWSLAGMGAPELIRELNSVFATPVVVVTDRPVKGVEKEALGAGAVSVFRMSSGDDCARQLAANLLAMSRVRVLRRRPPADSCGGPALVGVACSTGGPPALLHLLRDIGPDLGAPIVVPQHIGSDFADGFRDWLSRESGLPVEWAASFEKPQPNTVYLAPPGKHLTCHERGFLLLSCANGPGPCPSATLFFESVASVYGAAAIGVILTGMGDDGAAGLLRMRQAGAYTVAQDQATSEVYGMPASAVALGAAVQQLPLELIGKRLHEIARLGRERYGQGTHL